VNQGAACAASTRPPSIMEIKIHLFVPDKNQPDIYPDSRSKEEMRA
jgi:hypothetical protein